jgi:hypothetical protein
VGDREKAYEIGRVVEIDINHFFLPFALSALAAFLTTSTVPSTRPYFFQLRVAEE